jgi:glycosyltransferase involved in cell wall biosynthesis
LDKHLHIVTHDVPWPVDYGGVVDIFYKIKTLSQLGIKIHLHCFTKNKLPQPLLNRFCETVEYYERKITFQSCLLPYIVSSRNDKRLLKNLKKDNYPILLEGIHCTYHLFKNKLEQRKILVRLFNVEHYYYDQIAKTQKSVFKKYYAKVESFLLLKYEKKLARKNITFLALSNKDKVTYENKLLAQSVYFIPPFIGWNKIKTTETLGNFCLYHGNLSVSENEKAAEWLLKEVFTKLEIPFVIAGKNPSPYLKKLAHQFSHTCLVENPSEHELDDLIRKAQINIIPSFNQTGIKLKLINVLLNGKHCITNLEGVEGSGLNALCSICHDSFDFQQKISTLFIQNISEEDILIRKEILENVFNNISNANKLMSLIY